MLRFCGAVAALLAVGSEALPLGAKHTLKKHALTPGADDVLLHSQVSGFEKLANRACSGQNELGEGEVKDLADCASLCSGMGICVSFMFDESSKKCQRSSTCTPDQGANAFAGWDLYVKVHPAYTAYEAMACEGEVYSRTNPSRGLKECAERCTGEKKCASFEYRKDKNKCHLSNKCTAKHAHESLTGWNLYVKNVPPPSPPSPEAPPPPSLPLLTVPQTSCSPTCTSAVWNAEASNAAKGSLARCGDRIMYRAKKEFHDSFFEACKAVADKFEECDECYPTENVRHLKASEVSAMTAAPTAAPTSVPTHAPTRRAHTSAPSSAPTSAPTSGEGSAGASFTNYTLHSATACGNVSDPIVLYPDEGLTGCKDLCDADTTCASFEFRPADSACHVSSYCNVAHSNGEGANPNWNLYVKDFRGYKKFKNVACTGRDDLGTTWPSGGLTACLTACDEDDECQALQFKSQTGKCELSSTCTRKRAEKEAGWDLYVKKGSGS